MRRSRRRDPWARGYGFANDGEFVGDLYLSRSLDFFRCSDSSDVDNGFGLLSDILGRDRSDVHLAVPV